MTIVGTAGKENKS